MHIAILDDYQDVVRTLDCFTLLRDHRVTVFTDTPSENALIERLQDVDALVLIRERTRITPQLLARLPRLTVISQTGKASSNINAEQCCAAGVDVLEGIGSPVAPSELCWSLIMAASRHIPAYADACRHGEWQQSGLGLGRTLSGLTLGIWGYGKIGQRIARYANAFDMQVVVWGSEGSRAQAEQDGFISAANKAAFFSSADILSLHLRLHPATTGCVTGQDLALMKSDALFVNTSRAELVEQGALYHALAAGHPGFAAIDVFENEPCDTSNEPLLTLPNVLATPHLGYVEKNSYELYFKTAFENLVRYINDVQAKRDESNQ